MAEKRRALLEQARHNRADWRFRELERLYSAFGFEREEGGKHVIFVHAVHQELWTTVTRSSPLPIGYITTAVRLCDEVLKRGGQNDE
jgi:hypothetical protein